MSVEWVPLKESKTESPLNRRETLLALRLILDASMPKIMRMSVSDSKRAGFARVAVQAATAAATILKDVELENLERRLSVLEQKS